MSLKLTTREKNGVTIIDASGKITLGESTGTLRTNIRQLVEGGARQFILNLADATYVDSSGLGEMISAHTTITTAGGEIKLLNLAKRVHDLLQLTKLYTVFETFEDEETAVNSFKMAKSV